MNGRLLSAQPVSESGCQRQSWSQRDFISGISTSPGLAVERILFPSVPEPEMSLFNKSGIGEFIWPSRFLLVSSPCSSPVLIPYPSCRYGLWLPSQWFFQLLTRWGGSRVSLLTPSEFGLLLHFTCLVAGSPSRDWQLHICFVSVDVLAGNCRQGSSTACASKNIYIYIWKTDVWVTWQ